MDIYICQVKGTATPLWFSQFARILSTRGETEPPLDSLCSSCRCVEINHASHPYSPNLPASSFDLCLSGVLRTPLPPPNYLRSAVLAGLFLDLLHVYTGKFGGVLTRSFILWDIFYLQIITNGGSFPNI